MGLGGHEVALSAGRRVKPPSLILRAVGSLRLAVAVWLPLRLGAAAAGAGAPEAEAEAWLRQRLPLRSASGRFEAVGGPSALKTHALGWAEEIAAKLDGFLDQPPPPPRASVVLDLRLADPAGTGRVAIAERGGRGEGQRRLILTNPDAIDPEESAEALCRLLLMERLAARRAAAAAPDAPAPPGGNPAPRWLWMGLAQNLYPAGRARNNARCLELWRAGRPLTVAEILRRGVGEDAPPSAEAVAEGQADLWSIPNARAVFGTFAAWLLSLPGRSAVWEAALQCAAEGRRLEAEHLASLVPGCRSAADLEERWDAWLLSLQRRIVLPGVTTTEAWEALRSALLLYPGVSGIPLDEGTERPWTCADLIGRRDAPWMAVCAQAQATRLRLLAAGRGDEFRRVAESYARFFDALGARQRERVLRRLLQEAETRRRQAEAGGQAGGAADAGDENTQHLGGAD